MDRIPRLIVVTGRPGSGKTTLARCLAETIGWGALHRDQVKQELALDAEGTGSGPVDNSRATDVFFERLERRLAGGLPCIADAAFQHRLWESRLAPLASRARILVVVCCVSRETNRERRRLRAQSDSEWLALHPDPTLEQFLATGVWSDDLPYEPPRLEVP
ncbi:MAG: AAA family ATPase, partial [Armatimonadaceae bacterium]